MPALVVAPPRAAVFRRALSAAALAGLILGTGALTESAAAKSGRNGALLGGVAAGVVGGVLLNQAIQGHAQAAPDPVYVEPAPPPARRVYVEPQPVYVRPAPPPYDPDLDRAERLHDGCDEGDRRACINFGILIGQHRERQADWRRRQPDMFAWDRY